MSSGRLPTPNPVALGPGYHSPDANVTVRLNTNESAVPPPQEFLDELAAVTRQLGVNRYPDRRATELREAIGSRHRLGGDHIFCANGSNEVLQCLMLAYGGPGRSAAVFEPTYALHAHIARLTGTGLVPGERDEAFAVDPAAAAALLDRVAAELGDGEPALSFLCSPNNPTGNAERRQTVDELAAAVPGLLVVDEAYVEFAPWSALEPPTAGDGPREEAFANGVVATVEMPARREQVVVVRTFSKTWAMAGLRLGYLVAEPAVVSACERVALPYHLDALKQAAGLLALRFGAEMRVRTAAVVGERRRVEAALALLGVRVWPSDANFILFRPLGHSAAGVWQGLVERSVLVRDVSAWPRLEGCLRVTIGTAEENDAFLDALASVLEDPGTCPNL